MSKQSHSQFALLGSRRFLPLFITQFLGAFNDNVFKNSLIILLTFSSAYHSGADSTVLVNAAAGIFILPFFLFSATAGQLADKYDKAMLMRWIKLAEIGIMICASAGFMLHQVNLLLLALFFMGMHSTFYGPAKYSVLPQHLEKNELVGGNALIESGTFLAILLGTLLGGIVTKSANSETAVSISILVIAILGYFSSRAVPPAPSLDPNIKINWNPITETWQTMSFASTNKTLFNSILGISWFWFLGAAYLTQLPHFTKNVLFSDETVVTLLLTTFSIGIAVGSLLCERLSGHKVELGLVPLGSIGLSWFSLDLFLSPFPAFSGTFLSVGAFLKSAIAYRVIVDLMLLGVFGGLYIVPLYALVQERSDPSSRSRIIAANNIFNALFMVASAALAVALFELAKLTIPQFFLVLCIMNIVVAVYVYTLVPEFFMRFLIWVLTHTMYRVTHKNLDNIPEEGPAVLVCNHVSFVDALLIGGSCRRPVRFVMYKPIFDVPVLNFIFRTGKAIPIHSQKADPETYKRAFARISEELRNGEVVCIFPEGKLTTDGEIDEFKTGVEKILHVDPVPVIPMALQGLWGSFFSHKDGHAMTRMPKRFWSKVNLVCGVPMDPHQVNAALLREEVLKLRGDQR